MAGAAPTETQLSLAAAAGDSKAFGELVKLHQAAVRGFCRRLSRSVSEGDDIAQSAFLVAWRRRSTWRGGSFRGWVCAIAYREFLHLPRGREVQSVEGLEPEGEEESPGERMDLTRAMARLDEGERAAVALCLGAGLSHSEAALVLEAPLGTVKSWVLRGRAKLQQMLAAYERV